MGSQKKATVVNYDASIRNAQMKSRSLDLLSNASMEALASQKMAVYAGEQAKQDIEEGLSLLGSYLKDRNQAVKSQTPIYESFLSGTSSNLQSYSDKASGVLSRISGGYTNG